MHELLPLLGHPRQYASVRRMVFDDGPERGGRALLFSTGGGLDFTVLPDRGFDIGSMQFRGLPVAWHSPGGFRGPGLTRPEDDHGFGFDRSFSGFLMTCGLDNARQSRAGSPQHGRLPGTPGTLWSSGEDWTAEVPTLFAEGEVVQWIYNGEHLALRRRIEAPIGGTTLTLRDTVANRGVAPTPHEIMYHFNLGYPLVSQDANVTVGERQVWSLAEFPTSGEDARALVCVPAAARGERTTLTSGAGPSPIALRFDTGASLGYIQLYRDLKPGIGLLAVEPCSTDNDDAPLAPLLPPGESRDYTVTISLFAP